MDKKQEVDNLYKNLIEIAQSDPNVLGLFSTGSRGKNMITEFSDCDATIIVKDDVLKNYQNKYKGFGGLVCDLSIMTLQMLKEHAEWDSPTAWNRYNYTHLKAEIDKTGEIQKLIDEKAIIPEDKRNEFILGCLDDYINDVYRSVKCFRDKNIIASHLEAAESISPLLNAIFALERRIKPFYKYLDWELTDFPLKKLPWSKDEFINTLIEIVKTADIRTQQEVLKIIEQLFRKEGFGLVFDGWEELLPWMETYNPNN